MRMGLERGINTIESVLKKNGKGRSGLGREGKESGNALRQRNRKERLARLWDGVERRNKKSSEDGEEF